MDENTSYDSFDSFSGSAFEGEYFKFLDNITSFADLQNHIIKGIEKAKHLSVTAKEAYKRVVKSMITTNTLLSIQNDTEIPECRMKIELLLARAACTRPDTNRPELLQIERELADVFSFLVTRTLGRERERKLLLPQMHHTSVQTLQEKSGEERGFKLPFQR